MATALPSIGDRYKANVTDPIINKSDPCQRGTCMMSQASHETLIQMYGQRDFNIRSNNDGFKFRLDDHNITAAFLPGAGRKLYNFDYVYKMLRIHAHTVEQAKKIARAAGLAASRAGASNKEAMKAADAAYTAARKPMPDAEAKAAARAAVKPFKSGFIVTGVTKVGAPPTPEARKRLDKLSREKSESGEVRTRWSKARQLSI